MYFSWLLVHGKTINEISELKNDERVYLLLYLNNLPE